MAAADTAGLSKESERATCAAITEVEISGVGAQTRGRMPAASAKEKEGSERQFGKRASGVEVGSGARKSSAQPRWRETAKRLMARHAAANDASGDQPNESRAAKRCCGIWRSGNRPDGLQREKRWAAREKRKGKGAAAGASGRG